MRVEELKQKLDKLDETQLQLVAKFISALEEDTDQSWSLMSDTTPQEKAEAFLAWVSGLPKGGHSLPDEAFDRATIYD
jgi:hypothetical protein